MSVDNVFDIEPRRQYQAAAAQTDFDYPFPIFEDGDLVVDVDGVTQALGTDYTVDGEGEDTGGTVTFLSAMAGGEIVTIFRDIPIARTSDFQLRGPLSSSTFNDELDRITMVEQQLESRLGRTVRLPVTNQQDTSDLELGAAFYGKLLSVNSSGELEPATVVSGTLSKAIVNALLHPRTAVETSAGVVTVDESIPSYEIAGSILASRYSIDTTGVSDSTAGVQLAVAVAEALDNNTVILPYGWIRIDGTITIKQGVLIMGGGSQGSTLGYGTSIEHHSNSNLFSVNPAAAPDASSTGGGFKNLTIVKATGFSGGIAISVINANDLHRAGEMMIQNVLIYGTGTGRWAKGIFFDGTLTNTPGARGVRTVHFDKVRVASCTTNNQYVHLTQCTHVVGNIEVDTANGTGTTGMTIDGYWDNINLELRVGGNVIVEHTGTPGVDFPGLNLGGKCEDLDINYSSTVGNVNMIIGSEVTCTSKSVRISSNHADAFQAYKSASTINQTGNGTAYTLVSDTEVYDKNLTHDAATGICTIKCAGLHQFKAQVSVSGLTASHTAAVLQILHSASGGGAIRAVEKLVNIGAIRNASNQASIDLTTILDCSETDTVRVKLTISNGGADDADIIGAATLYSYFEGKLLA